MMVNQSGRKKGSRRVILVVSVLPLIIIVVLVVWRPVLLPYFFKYAKLIFSEVMNDNQRFVDNELQVAFKEWKLYQMESRFNTRWCEENSRPREDVTWLTALVNDDFAIPALVLGHTIRKFSCQRNMIAFVAETVSKGARNALEKVGWSTRMVQEMDCNWLDRKLGAKPDQRLFARPGGPRIRGTHTRFHAWNYTQFSKIIYVDADYMLMSNIDDLFDIPDDFAAAPCARPGVLDPCFNAGLLVFRPDTKDYQAILDLWYKTTKEDFCPNDQVLLLHYYADVGNWKALPYAFNVRRIVYRPMRGFHFACCVPPKPWSAECRPSRQEAKAFVGPILDVNELGLIFWQNFYELLDRYHLDKWWKSTKFHRPLQEFGEETSVSCWKQFY